MINKIKCLKYIKFDLFLLAMVFEKAIIFHYTQIQFTFCTHYSWSGLPTWIPTFWSKTVIFVFRQVTLPIKSHFWYCLWYHLPTLTCGASSSSSDESSFLLVWRGNWILREFLDPGTAPPYCMRQLHQIVLRDSSTF